MRADLSPKVGYSLTELGAGLAETVTGIRFWAHSLIDDIEAARATFDGTSPPPVS